MVNSFSVMGWLLGGAACCSGLGVSAALFGFPGGLLRCSLWPHLSMHWMACGLLLIINLAPAKRQ